MELEKELIDQAILRLNENTQRIEKCLHQLSEKEVWLKPNEKSNPMGNLMLHLCGNITQYIISSLGDTEDVRERDKEFLAEGGLSKADLMGKLKNVIVEATNVLVNLKKEKLLKKYSVQGFELTGIGIVIHVVEHYSYHTGQIAFYTKLLKERDLEFYNGINLNVKNK